MAATDDLVELVHSSDIGFTEFFSYVLENVLFKAICLHSLILLPSNQLKGEVIVIFAVN